MNTLTQSGIGEDGGEDSGTDPTKYLDVKTLGIEWMPSLYAPAILRVVVAKAKAHRDAVVMAAVQAFRRTYADFNRRLANAGDSGLSMADTMALHYVAHAGPVTAGDLARFTGLTTGAVTSMVDRLEDAGYLERHRAKNDRRVVQLRLKPGAGQKLMVSMMAAHTEVGGLFDDLSTTEVEGLVAMLERLNVAE